MIDFPVSVGQTGLRYGGLVAAGRATFFIGHSPVTGCGDGTSRAVPN